MRTQSERSSSCGVVDRCCEQDGGMKSRLARAIVACMSCVQGVGFSEIDCSIERVA